VSLVIQDVRDEKTFSCASFAYKDAHLVIRHCLWSEFSQLKIHRYLMST
jgi:hypothetical protein